MKLNKIYQERKHIDKAAEERDDNNRLIRKAILNSLKANAILNSLI